MATFVLLHSLWCLLKIFVDFNFQYCLHLIPYYIFIEFLKPNLKQDAQNTDQEINLSLQITQAEEKFHYSSENADNKFTIKYKATEYEVPIEGQMMSDISIQQNMDAISSEMDTKGFNFSPSKKRSNITETWEQISMLSSETTLVQGTQYTFYDDNEEKFIIDNANFEEEEK
ncbi:hypothetical protein TNCT_503721 [Trichonephila clavata]|uniref:Uncharacterized protein n=1 Tax=Trichonephila clavata TaxID=2740835 RepID=A0A8X6LDE3_TRICU|nr:hypothetical protein TNCT_503721 [Trichonephila clavata]